jgi:hypothetical protein
MTDFQKPSADLASSESAQNLKFERADWTSFRTVEGLQQKAGVAQGKLRRLVLKELADNALDTGTPVQVGVLEGGGYFIEDQGPGLDPKAVARLYSINRPLISTKLLRSATASGWSPARSWRRTASSPSSPAGGSSSSSRSATARPA